MDVLTEGEERFLAKNPRFSREEMIRVRKMMQDKSPRQVKVGKVEAIDPTVFWQNWSEDISKNRPSLP